MSENAAPRLGHGDIRLLQDLVMDAGRKAVKNQRKARKRKDKAAIGALDHMAEHLAKVHIKLSAMNGDGLPRAMAERMADLLSGLTGVKATVVGPGDPEHELLKQLREKDADEEAARSEAGRHGGDAPAAGDEAV